jgi:hypothetical protein
MPRIYSTSAHVGREGTDSIATDVYECLLMLLPGTRPVHEQLCTNRRLWEAEVQVRVQEQALRATTLTDAL